MKRAFWITLLAILAFAVMVVARLPASWVVPTPPSQVSCAGVDGTIWTGVCAGLTVQGKPIGDVTWQVHPTRLLAGKVAAHVVLTSTSSTARADVEVGLDKNLLARNLVADLPIDSTVIPQVPPTLRGSAHADLALARVEKGLITQLQGRIEVHDLMERSGNVTKLGSYSVTFPAAPAGEPTGQLRDLGDGPLTFEGTLRLTHEPGYALEGLVAPRGNAPPELTQTIRFLGSPDAQGRRPFGLQGTF